MTVINNGDGLANEKPYAEGFPWTLQSQPDDDAQDDSSPADEGVTADEIWVAKCSNLSADIQGALCKGYRNIFIPAGDYTWTHPVFLPKFTHANVNRSVPIPYLRTVDNGGWKVIVGEEDNNQAITEDQMVASGSIWDCGMVCGVTIWGAFGETHEMYGASDVIIHVNKDIPVFVAPHSGSGSVHVNAKLTLRDLVFRYNGENTASSGNSIFLKGYFNRCLIENVHVSYCDYFLSGWIGQHSIVQNCRLLVRKACFAGAVYDCTISSNRIKGYVEDRVVSTNGAVASTQETSIVDFIRNSFEVNGVNSLGTCVGTKLVGNYVDFFDRMFAFNAHSQIVSVGNVYDVFKYLLVAVDTQGAVREETGASFHSHGDLFRRCNNWDSSNGDSTDKHLKSQHAVGEVYQMFPALAHADVTVDSNIFYDVEYVIYRKPTSWSNKGLLNTFQTPSGLATKWNYTTGYTKDEGTGLGFFTFYSDAACTQHARVVPVAEYHENGETGYYSTIPEIVICKDSDYSNAQVTKWRVAERRVTSGNTGEYWLTKQCHIRGGKAHMYSFRCNIMPLAFRKYNGITSADEAVLGNLTFGERTVGGVTFKVFDVSGNENCCIDDKIDDGYTLVPYTQHIDLADLNDVTLPELPKSELFDGRTVIVNGSKAIWIRDGSRYSGTWVTTDQLKMAAQAVAGRARSLTAFNDAANADGLASIGAIKAYVQACVAEALSGASQ